MSDWTIYNLNDINNSLNEILTNGNGDYKEVPRGKYEVKSEKLELKATKDGRPMGFCQMRIQTGEYAKQCLFYNQVLVGTDKKTGKTTALGLHNFNKFVFTLSSRIPVKFKDFEQYGYMLLDVSEDIEKQHLSYEVEYSKKGEFSNYRITDIFED